jgi:Glycosyl transferase family 2
MRISSFFTLLMDLFFHLQIDTFLVRTFTREVFAKFLKSRKLHPKATSTCKNKFIMDVLQPSENPVDGWGVFHSEATTIPERVMSVLLVVVMTIINFYSFSKLLNVVRAVWSTNFFTSKPLEGGNITPGDEPTVTIQICCYNEPAVIEATINAACSVDWPKDKLYVQILDDSTDNTVDIVENVSASWRERGVNCVRLARPTRRGYKAGNLHDMQDKVEGEFMALFDADHRCHVNFLKRTMPQFFNKDGSPKPEIGLVQVPWYVWRWMLLLEWSWRYDRSHHSEKKL